MNEDAFWALVESARVACDSDPLAMGRYLRRHFAEPSDDELIGFQMALIAATERVNTWMHVGAAEMASGFISHDVFCDWRSWLITRGRTVFDGVAVDPDALADVDDLTDGADVGGQGFTIGVESIWYERHGAKDRRFQFLCSVPGPGGERPTYATVRVALPRMAARFPDAGLPGPPP